jgi:hypothetical protein
MAKIAVPDPPWTEIPHIEVDALALAEMLDCDERTVRKYAQMGIAKRTARDRYALFESIAGVVEHFRGLASQHGTAEAMRANAALKDAQRRLVDFRYEQLNSQLISLAEIKAMWGDLVQATEWLFLALPGRAKLAFPHLTGDQQAALERLSRDLLSEAAIKGDPPLPKPANRRG